MSNPELIKKLEQTIENIPDFPKPGIQFKDITPIFLNPKLYEDITAGEFLHERLVELGLIKK